MKTDKDDIPEHLRPRRKRGPWRGLPIMAVGSAIFWGLASQFGKPIVIDVAQLKQAIRFGGEPLFSQPPAPPEPPPSQALQGNDQDWNRSRQAQQTIQANRELEEWSRQHAQATHERQTSFNDSNYTPKQPASTYTPPRSHLQASAQPQQQRTVQRERTQRWIKSWDGDSRYLAMWISVNNRIDGTTVCTNHKRCSINYRECRKAAKQHYHDQCKTWRARHNNDRLRDRYCTAASGFSPMG